MVPFSECDAADFTGEAPNDFIGVGNLGGIVSFESPVKPRRILPRSRLKLSTRWLMDKEGSLSDMAQLPFKRICMKP